jgi:peptidoglycan/LPS O-acetylase OafA/YrhL
LDGVRAIAVLLVIYQHVVRPDTLNVGFVGVWIFFALSGFLLVQPFQDAATYQPSGLANYAMRRLLRILPMYYFTVIGVSWGLGLPHPVDGQWLAKHLTFAWSSGVLWTVKQELLFYVALPFLMWAARPLSSSGMGRTACFLGLAILYSHAAPMAVFSVSAWEPSIYIALYFNVFLFGMAAGCFIHTRAAKRIMRARAHWLIGNGLVGALLFFWYRILLGFSPSGLYLDATWIASFCAGAVLFGLLVSLVIFRHNLLGLLLRFPPLRALGIIGYSMYLLHYPLIAYLEPLGLTHGTRAFIGVVCITALLASITYAAIERPFMMLALKKWRRAQLA